MFESQFKRGLTRASTVIHGPVNYIHIHLVRRALMRYHTEMFCECYKETENYWCKTVFCKTKLKFYKSRTTTIFGISGKMKDYL